MLLCFVPGSKPAEIVSYIAQALIQQPQMKTKGPSFPELRLLRCLLLHDCSVPQLSTINHQLRHGRVCCPERRLTTAGS